MDVVPVAYNQAIALPKTCRSGGRRPDSPCSAVGWERLGKAGHSDGFAARRMFDWYVSTTSLDWTASIRSVQRVCTETGQSQPFPLFCAITSILRLFRTVMFHLRCLLCFYSLSFTVMGVPKLRMPFPISSFQMPQILGQQDLQTQAQDLLSRTFSLFIVVRVESRRLKL